MASRCWIGVAVAVIATVGFAWAAEDAPVSEENFQKILDEGTDLYAQGKIDEGLVLAQEAIKIRPRDARSYYLRALLYETKLEIEKSLVDYNKVIELDLRAPAEMFNRRGVVHFKLGLIEESVRDFDMAIRLEPRMAPSHWQRGISLYYAGEYKKGQLQFESSHRGHTQDVENSVWRYLCMARSDGPEEARGAIYRVTGDPRVPMKQIMGMFAGENAPEQVMAAAEVDAPSPREERRQLFYANLYIGLYHEAQGHEKKAYEYIQRAAEKFRVEHYMGDVAHVHTEILEKKLSSDDPTASDAQ